MAERLTAMDVEKQEFSRKLRGYEEGEVRLYLKSVADEMGRLNLENGEQREELGRLRRQIEDFQQRERTLQEALVAGQRLGEDLMQKSRSEAELLVKEARIRSERLLQQSQEQLARIEDEIGRARLERDTFEQELRRLVEQHLSVLDLRRRDRPDYDNLRVMRSVKGTDAG